MRTTIPELSKSRFMAGLQCHKRLYLELYAPELAGPPDSETTALFAANTTVGEVARQCFPGGQLIAHDLQHTDAAVQTMALLDDVTVPSIYEAAFAYDDVAVRVDIVARRGDHQFDLIEVTPTDDTKESHLFDLAVQFHVLHVAGVPVDRTCLMYLNRRYVYQGGTHDPDQLFTCIDWTEHVRALQPHVAAALAAIRQSLRADVPPAIPTGAHCTTPYRCAFFDNCHSSGPEHPIEELPDLREPLRQQLTDLGI